MNRIEKNGKFYCEVTHYKDLGIIKKDPIKELSLKRLIGYKILNSWNISTDKEIDIGFVLVINEKYYDIVEIDLVAKIKGVYNYNVLTMHTLEG